MATRFTLGMTAILAGAAALGIVLGISSTSRGRAEIVATAKRAAIAGGAIRMREPQPGDHWDGCDAPRALGTAPIYRGEPGYRAEMDGDNDGIACEPVRD